MRKHVIILATISFLTGAASMLSSLKSTPNNTLRKEIIKKKTKGIEGKRGKKDHSDL